MFAAQAGSADLQLGHVRALQELHKPRDDPLANHLLNGGIPLCSKHSTVSHCAQVMSLQAAERERLGCAPMESSLRNCVVASNCCCGSSDHTPRTIAGRLSSCTQCTVASDPVAAQTLTHGGK